MQAAQKTNAIAAAYQSAFTAVQAAQKLEGVAINALVAFTAVQAAQKMGVQRVTL